ncbi:MAG TPA: biotin-dependent carboxyltransferase family protein [Actinospica sp.]|jgi:biotin-dependent carboxylase-like uncharacterized protein|nr:biotin-dependent carboxyltransferase family protein [Actinospica sp.]
MIEIEDPGPRTTVQDLGRPGYAALGVGRSGAADRGALRLANRLVGNPEQLAGLELTLGGLRARFHRPALVAVTGAGCPMAVDGANNDAGMNAPFAMRAGQVLRIGTPERGLRTYLAVRGGIDVPEVLGSRSTDTLSGIGPAVVGRAAVLPVGHAALGFPDTDLAVRREPADDEPVAVLPGPRADWFTAAAIDVLTSNPYTVTAEADRIGARLDGPRLERAEERELRSEGMVCGALQVPPDGRPILFLADHPVTGGYPVIAVVRAADLDRAAQLRPGDAVRFRLARPSQASSGFRPRG